MKKEELTEQNYHGLEMRKKYMSYSLFKKFEQCEVMALAYVNGEYEQPKTDALIYGGYVDADFSGTLDEFIEENKDKLYSPKTGKMYAAFANVDKTIETFKNDDMLNYYLQGEHQVILTGEIMGIPFKGKLDVLNLEKNFFTDQKVMKDFEDVWVKENGRNVKKNWIDAYGYTYEGAIFQELLRQREGRLVPFYLDAVSKEDIPDKKLVHIEDDVLEAALEHIKENAPRYRRIQLGLEKPIGCGHCPVCLARKKITEPESYKETYLEKEEDY